MIKRLRTKLGGWIAGVDIEASAPKALVESIRPDDISNSHIGVGEFEISTADDGLILISALGASGEFQWYKLEPRNAYSLGDKLKRIAAIGLDDKPMKGGE